MAMVSLVSRPVTPIVAPLSSFMDLYFGRAMRSYVGPLTRPPTIFNAAPFSMALMVVIADDADM